MKKHKFFAVFTAALLAFTVFGCKQNDDSNPEKCTLTYDANGGSGEMKNATGDEGTEITLTANAFTKTGYTFTEWNTKADGSGTDYEDKAKIRLTANTTLYAQWKANTYTVTFDANGGIGNALTDIPATYDKEFELPENTFAKIGYNFAGWKDDASGKVYADKSTVNNLTAENGATVTLYAQWKERGTHKITYVLNNGNHSGTPTTSFKETEDVTLGTAERTGYTFSGWYEAEDFSGTAVSGWNAGKKTENITLYAKWTANTYTVTFNANGGSGTMESQTFTYGTPQALNENKFTRTGYDFAGWATSANGNVTYKDSQDYSISAENVTLYAIWEAIKYTITYELDGGTNAAGNPARYTIEDSITLEAPTKAGYSFGGWYEAEDFSGNTVTNWKAGEKTEDLTLYAKWEAINYTITYELDGGTNADGNPTSYTIEDSIALKDPTKASFTFVCWYSDRSKKTEIAKGSTGDIELQAVWKDNVDFVKVPAVSITGSENWTPASKVFVSGRKLEIKAFWMSDHEVTRGEYKEIMGSASSETPAYDIDGNELTGDAADNNPVNYVSWYDAIVYCNKRSIKESLTPCYTVNGSTDSDKLRSEDVTCDFTANGYRLPTEAEWEWAARGGENYKYAGSDDINEVAWWFDNTEGTGTREVKTKEANGYGLYDMSGNVNEWCWDWWSENISSSTPATGDRDTRNHSMRGGSWNLAYDEEFEVASHDGQDDPDCGRDFSGFRVVRTAE